jgi:hypothetical protein
VPFYDLKCEKDMSLAGQHFCQREEKLANYFDEEFMV